VLIPHQVCVRRVHFAHAGMSVRTRANIGVPLSSQSSVGILNLFSASVVRNTEDAGGSTIVIHNERVVETLERAPESRLSTVVQSVHVTTFVMLFPERDLLDDGLLGDLRIPKVPHHPAFGTLQLDDSGPGRILSSKYIAGLDFRLHYAPLYIRCSCAASVSPVDDYFS